MEKIVILTPEQEEELNKKNSEGKVTKDPRKVIDGKLSATLKTKEESAKTDKINRMIASKPAEEQQLDE